MIHSFSVFHFAALCARDEMMIKQKSELEKSLSEDFKQPVSIKWDYHVQQYVDWRQNMIKIIKNNNNKQSLSQTLQSSQKEAEIFSNSVRIGQISFNREANEQIRLETFRVFDKNNLEISGKYNRYKIFSNNGLSVNFNIFYCSTLMDSIANGTNYMQSIRAVRDMKQNIKSSFLYNYFSKNRIPFVPFMITSQNIKMNNISDLDEKDNNEIKWVLQCTGNYTSYVMYVEI